MVLAQSRIFGQIAPKNYAVFWRNLGFALTLFSTYPAINCIFAGY